MTRKIIIIERQPVTHGLLFFVFRQFLTFSLINLQSFSVRFSLIFFIYLTNFLIKKLDINLIIMKKITAKKPIKRDPITFACLR